MQCYILKIASRPEQFHGPNAGIAICLGGLFDIDEFHGEQRLPVGPNEIDMDFEGVALEQIEIDRLLSLVHFGINAGCDSVAISNTFSVWRMTLFVNPLNSTIYW